MLSEEWEACCAGEARESVFSPDEERASEGILIKAIGLRRRVLTTSELKEQQYCCLTAFLLVLILARSAQALLGVRNLTGHIS